MNWGIATVVSIASLKEFFFKVLHGFRGYPRKVGTQNFRFDESLRRWNFDGEEEVRLAIFEHLDKDDTAIDIGANFGMHTLIMADRVGGDGRVLAFEPVTANLDLLRRNVSLNQFDDRVKIVESAISDIPDDHLKMTMMSDALEPSAAISVKQDESQQTIEVQNQSLDAAAEKDNWSGNCFVKIDVEGAELSVLRSGEQFLKSVRPSLLIEVHDYALPQFGASTEEVYAFLEDHGYDVKQISDMNNHNGEYHHVMALPRQAAA